MKITKIYSNYPEIFNSIEFNVGLKSTTNNTNLLNIVLAEFKDVKNFGKTSHNLGKTKLLELMDFLLLKDLDKKHFLVINENKFKKFIFYLEILLNSGHYITIKRCVFNPTKISIKKYSKPYQDFSNLSNDDFDFYDLPIEKAKEVIDGELNLIDIYPFTFRNGLSYFIRSQNDYGDLFQISKFQGQHKFWKPYLWKIFGFDNKTMLDKYELDEEIKKLQLDKMKKERESGQEIDINAIRIIINQQKIDISKIEIDLDSFNFTEEEKKISEYILNKIEEDISSINQKIFTIDYNIKKCQESLEQEIPFNMNQIEKIYKEVNIVFPNDIRKKYDDLISFNRKITIERNKFLKENTLNLNLEKEKLLKEKEILNNQRIEKAKALSSSNSLEKYKKLQKNFTEQKASLLQLENSYKSLLDAKELDKEIKEKLMKLNIIINELEENIENPSTICKNITEEFTKLVKRVWNIPAVIKIYKNKENNIDFEVQTFKENNGKLIRTKDSDGHTCKKILCVLFDLAILRVYCNRDFFRFVYHDGVMEALEPKKRELLFNVIKETCNQYNIQYIFSLMECEKSSANEYGLLQFEETDVVVKLNDSGAQGRLFKMESF